MRSSLRFALIGALVLGAAPGIGADAQDTQSGAVPTLDYAGARLIHRPKLSFPLDQEREAVVTVRFLISAEGIPEEVEVDELAGFFNDRFRALALEYVQGLRFEPARLNGQPVEAGPLLQTINFGFAGKVDPEMQGVNEEFLDELNKVERMLRQRDFAGAHHHAEWMLREKVQLRFEFAVLQAQLAQTHATVGNLKEALAAARAATIRSGTEVPGFQLRQPAPANDPGRYTLSRNLILQLLEMRMRLEVQEGLVLTALKTYNELAGLKKFKNDDPVVVLADALTTLLESGKPLVFPGRVVGEFWSHEQFHPGFTVANVRGKIELFHAHCRGGLDVYPYVAGSTWTLPADARACVVEVYAEPGTTFDFVELPSGYSMDAAKEVVPE